MRTGLTSVTFRKLSADEIIELAAKAGLDGIEWGGDIHVPPASPVLAAETARKCREKGLAVLSYGSYWKGGEIEEFKGVLASAKALGAPVIRIWAGRAAPEAVSPEACEQLVKNVRSAAEMAAAEGIGIAFEYHRNTMTQTREGAERLLSALPERSIRAYWQPNPDISFEEQLRELDALSARLANLHVFAWEKDGARFPLSYAADKWRTYFAKAAAAEGEHDAILEFVKDDSPEQFLADAETLKQLLR